MPVFERLLSSLVLVVCFIAFSGSLSACLNDSELPDHEREFRSQYLSQPMVVAQSPQPRFSQRAIVMSAVGITLMAGSIGVFWKSCKRS